MKKTLNIEVIKHEFLRKLHIKTNIDDFSLNQIECITLWITIEIDSI